MVAMGYHLILRGQVAELADAIGLGPIVRTDLWVRVPPCPHKKTGASAPVFFEKKGTHHF